MFQPNYCVQRHYSDISAYWSRTHKGASGDGEAELDAAALITAA